MRGFPSVLFFAGVFGLGVVFRGDWTKLAATGVVLGILVALMHLFFDREIRSFDASSRWMIVRTRVTYGFVASALVAAFAFWMLSDGTREPGSEVSAAAMFLGFSVGSLFFELWARKRSPA